MTCDFESGINLLPNRFQVETKVVWVEERSLYLQQRVISVLDGFVRSDALLKMTNSGGGDRTRILRDEFGYERPETCPPFVKSFMGADEMGSRGLRVELEKARKER